MMSEAAVFLVGTPIGNLDDLSPRAIETLGVVDVVYAEDTRRTSGLFRRFGISTPLRSLHEHNEAARSEEIVERLRSGQSCALVTDAADTARSVSQPQRPQVGQQRRQSSRRLERHDRDRRASALRQPFGPVPALARWKSEKRETVSRES